MSTELVLKEEDLKLARNIDSVIKQALAIPATNGFEKAYVNSRAIATIETLITPEYMKEIMKMQGKKIGFLTDADKNGGYTSEKVKEIIIEAVLTGLQPVGNQFNIISSKMYPTKEGFTALLGRIEGLWKKFIFSTPRKEGDDTVIDVTVEWKTKEMSEKKIEKLTFPVKKNDGMGSDALIGKAERKAKRWLYLEVTGNDIADGDVGELNHELNAKKEEPKKEAPKETPTRNENVEEAEVVEETKSKVEIPEKDINSGNTYLERAKSVDDLNKRLGELQKKYPDFPLDKYNYIKAKLA